MEYIKMPVTANQDTSSVLPEGTSPRKNILIQALIRLSLRVGQKAEDDRHLEARIEIYADDLMAWDLECAMWCLNEHPNRSKWWPAWEELVELCGEWQREHRPQLSVVPEHHRLTRHRENNEFVPFPNRREWDEFCDAMRKLRDPDVPIYGDLRAPLLRLGGRIESRQRAHAESMGWA